MRRHDRWVVEAPPAAEATGDPAEAPPSRLNILSIIDSDYVLRLRCVPCPRQRAADIRHGKDASTACSRRSWRVRSRPL